jgi:hypothetical protein
MGDDVPQGAEVGGEGTQPAVVPAPAVNLVPNVAAPAAGAAGMPVTPGEGQ